MLRQDPEVSHLASLYLRWISLGLPGSFDTFVSHHELIITFQRTPLILLAGKSLLRSLKYSYAESLFVDDTTSLKVSTAPSFS